MSRLSRILICFTTSFFLKNTIQAQTLQPYLYSPKGEEMVIEFDGDYLTEFTSLESIKLLSPEARGKYSINSIEPTLKYLFGPLIYRSIGGIKKMLQLKINWEMAHSTENGIVIPFHYKGQWLVEKTFLDQSQHEIPLPLHKKSLLTPQWKKCTDDVHSEEGSLWYYWDPNRSGCDHKVNRDFQMVSLKVSEPTKETQASYPEYRRLIQNRNGKKTMAWTFAFGYYEEPDQPKPDSDKDIGAKEYQRFLRDTRLMLALNKPHETNILRSQYPYFWGEDFTLGHKFEFEKNGITYVIKVVLNARVDQMILFARSYAEEHDSYFAWLGHSRVGSGFDANRFSDLLKQSPELYSISKDYQIIFWGGCNSYTYYNEPFFEMKAVANSDDPHGTKGLDIIANGLPSLFALNAANAGIHLKALLNWQTPTTYQDLLLQMETRASYYGLSSLAVVIGDEDNEGTTLLR